MPAKPIDIGPLHFNSRGDAVKFLKDILHKYDVGDRVNDNDSEILRHALDLHPDSETIKGVGVKNFSVRSADFGTKCFWVNRTDGTKEKFSHKKCIYGDGSEK